MDNDMSVVTAKGLVPIGNGGGAGQLLVSTGTVGQGAINGNWTNPNTITNNFNVFKSPEQILDEFEMNEVVVEHKVTTFELDKLKETVDYNSVIKQNLAKMLSEHVVEKARFTKKVDPNVDAVSFRARVWVFNKEELLDLIKEIKNV
jgi:hypothetical protein